MDFLREALVVLVEGIMDTEVSASTGAGYRERSTEFAVFQSTKAGTVLLGSHTRLGGVSMRSIGLLAIWARSQNTIGTFRRISDLPTIRRLQTFSTGHESAVDKSTLESRRAEAVGTKPLTGYANRNSIVLTFELGTKCTL